MNSMHFYSTFHHSRGLEETVNVQISILRGEKILFSQFYPSSGTSLFIHKWHKGAISDPFYAQRAIFHFTPFKVLFFLYEGVKLKTHIKFEFSASESILFLRHMK